MPPYANMPRQPQCAASSGVIKPADDAPIANPLAASVVIDTRLVAGASSAQMPIVTGTVAPRPQPASRRQSIISNGPLEDIASSVGAPNSTRLTISSGRRPKRSASGLKNSAPIAMPASDADAAGAKAVGATPNSLAISGIAIANICAS